VNVFVALVIQHAMRMCHIAIDCLPLLYDIFPHYLKNGTIYVEGGGKSLNTKCVFWFPLQLSPETFLIYEELSEVWSKIYIGLHVIDPIFLSGFNDIPIGSTVFFSKITQISNFMTIRPVGAELLHENGRKVMPKLIVAIRTFAKAPKDESLRK
jgi:hypothetical protein